jgi:hypothetical protein
MSTARTAERRAAIDRLIDWNLGGRQHSAHRAPRED